MKTVLIADDVQTDRELMAQVVSKAGHHVEHAADGDEAVEKAKALRPALILLDVVMPKLDGFGACRKLKKDAETADIPIVLVTSKATDTDKFWGQKQGCDDYLVKPFTPDELTRVVRKFI
jgi:twitching motility two-component system response regulator PilH